jgi:hypothetical protein
MVYPALPKKHFRGGVTFLLYHALLKNMGEGRKGDGAEERKEGLFREGGKGGKGKRQGKVLGASGTEEWLCQQIFPLRVHYIRVWEGILSNKTLSRLNQTCNLT